MDFSSLYDRLWGMDGIHPFGNPDNLEEYMQDGKLEEEVCEFVKGNYKTVITCFFNKEGFMVGHTVVSDLLDGKELLDQLYNQLNTALEEEDFELAVQLQRRINELASKS